MDKNTEDILETVNFIKDTMMEHFDAIDKRFDAVDKRFDAVDKRLDNIENRLDSIESEIKRINAELHDVKSRLRVLEEKVGSQSGYAKEIDTLFSKVFAIEKELELLKAK